LISLLRSNQLKPTCLTRMTLSPIGGRVFPTDKTILTRSTKTPPEISGGVFYSV
jgi:hypothetical protein